MAHRQAPALPQSGKGDDSMRNPKLDCGLRMMSQVEARLRIVFKKVVAVCVVSCLAISLTLNLQIRTGEGLV